MDALERLEEIERREEAALRDMSKAVRQAIEKLEEVLKS